VGGLFRDGSGWAVFVVKAGRAVRRAIKSPRRNAVEAPAEDGLNPGDIVVVYPSDALRDGSRVTVK
ncbi:MAG: efflux transporter periplasmic adaptor subunit, partial [Isosphaeraceae bacterium]